MLLTSWIVTERLHFFQLCESAFNSSNVYAYHLYDPSQKEELKLEAANPRILLIDAHNSEAALSVIDELLESLVFSKPAVFVYLNQRTNHCEQTLLRKGVMYVFGNHMQENIMVDCIMNLYTLYFSLIREEGVRSELIRLLRDCQISPRHKGYSCICDSVLLMFSSGDYCQSLTKKIYPLVAQKQGATAERVEKNLRDAIRSGWTSGGRSSIPLLLGCGRDKPPTNGEFISCVCEKLVEIIHDKKGAFDGR